MLSLVHYHTTLFTKLSYFRKIYLINSRSFNLTKNKNLENKYICFIDSNFVTLDRLKREGSITINTKKMYYLYLKKLLNFLGKILKKKIVICIHPKNNDKLFYKCFKNFKIRKYATSKIISKSFSAIQNNNLTIYNPYRFDFIVISFSKKQQPKFQYLKDIKDI